MVLYIYMFSSRLAFSIVCEDNARFIVSVQHTATYLIGYLQFIEESLDLHVLMGYIS